MSDEAIDPVEHVRRRPGMYIGSTGPSGMVNLVLEVVSNSVDEALAGRAGTIAVTVHGDGSVSIVDDGDGMGARSPDGAARFVSEVLTSVHHTPTADGHRPHVHLSLGVGLLPAVALCAWFELVAITADEVVERRMERGVEVAGARTPNAGAPTGTSVHLRPDPEIFELLRWDLGRLQDELVRLAHLVPDLTIRFAVEPQEYGPHPDAVALFDEIHRTRTSDFGDPILISADRGLDAVRLVLSWRDSDWDGRVTSFCNLRPTDSGGTHVLGIEEGLRLVFGPGPTTRLMAGLDAVLHVLLLDAEYSGPTRGRLDSPEAIWLVADAIADQLPVHLEHRPDLDAHLRARRLTHP